MDFYEAEGKRLFQKFDIPTDPGVLYGDETVLDQVSFPCVVKAQVLSGKRGKAGGIKFANNREELETAIDKVSKVIVNGKKIEGILLVPKIDIAKEHYLGITIDSVAKQIVMIYTPCGGMDIEEVASETPDKVLKVPVTEEFDRDVFVEAIATFQLELVIVDQLADIAAKLYNMFCHLDATTVEINPLAQLADDTLTAADAKLVVDDNSLFRQGDYTLIPRNDFKTGTYAVANSVGLVYVELEKDGNVGIIAGGAGIGMATVDTLTFYGGTPFNFMDLGGGVSLEKMCTAARLLIENPQVEAILVNVFGGINNCKTMAEGLQRAIQETRTTKTIVVKSRGYSQEEGWKICDQLGLGQVRYGTTDDAVKLLLSRMEVRR